MVEISAHSRSTIAELQKLCESVENRQKSTRVVWEGFMAEVSSQMLLVSKGGRCGLLPSVFCILLNISRFLPI